MEFRLNKIEPEVRRKVNEMTSAGKVHTKNTIQVNADKEEKNSMNNLSEYKNKSNDIIVDATKEDINSFQVIATKEEDKKAVKGNFLDIRR